MKREVCSSYNGQKTDVLTVNGKSMASREISSVRLQVGVWIPVVVEMLALDDNL